jgi:hypothetical protein
LAEGEEQHPGRVGVEEVLGVDVVRRGLRALEHDERHHRLGTLSRRAGADGSLESVGSLAPVESLGPVGSTESGAAGAGRR